VNLCDFEWQPVCGVLIRGRVKASIAPLVGFVSGVLLLIASCERSPSVQAAREEMPSHQAQAMVNSNKPIDGELLAVNLADKRIVIRVENGMAQTFEWDDQTEVTGLPGTEQNSKSTTALLRRLAGKTGSEVTVQWRDDGAEKIATAIKVTYLVPGRTKRMRRRSRK
jgi:hypothetical protein